jgi:hypothetical protein
VDEGFAQQPGIDFGEHFSPVARLDIWNSHKVDGQKSVNGVSMNALMSEHVHILKNTYAFLM